MKELIAISKKAPGQINYASSGNLPTVIQQARAGRLRALAVTGAKRSLAVPDIPTVAESGVPGFEVTTWFGMSALARTPRPVIERLNGVIVKSLQTPDVHERISAQGAEAIGNTPEQFTTQMQRDLVKWAKVIKDSGAKLE